MPSNNSTVTLQPMAPLEPDTMYTVEALLQNTTGVIHGAVTLSYTVTDSHGGDVAAQQAAEAVFVQTASRMAAGIALLFALGTLVAWRIGGRISGAFQGLTEAADQLERLAGRVALQEPRVGEVERGLGDVVLAPDFAKTGTI